MFMFIWFYSINSEKSEKNYVFFTLINSIIVIIIIISPVGDEFDESAEIGLFVFHHLVEGGRVFLLLRGQ